MKAHKLWFFTMLAVVLSLLPDLLFASAQPKKQANIEKNAEKIDASLPPIGKRKYFLNEQQRAAPVDIESDAAPARGSYLKDPVSKASTLTRVVEERRIKAIPKLPVARYAQMRFKHLPVSGKLTRPRVQFTNDVLAVGRADEPIKQDFFPKVFDPALDYEF